MKLAPVQIPFQKIEVYSRCGKQYEYVEKRGFLVIPKPSPKAQLLKNIVCNAYVKATRHSSVTPWRQVTAAIDQFIFADLPDRSDSTYEEKSKIKFKESISWIKSIEKTWYNPYFREEGMEGFPGLRCAQLFTGNILVTDIVDLVLFNEKDLILCEFSEVEQTQSILYNNIRLRAQALMLSKNLSRNVTKLRSISWKNDREISVNDISIHQPDEFMRKTERAIQHMVNGIRSEVFYPSVNEQCITCPFNNICSF